MTKYADVITELALDNALTYSVPDQVQIEVGSRVVVTVSGRRHHGVVVRLHDLKPSYRVISLSQIVDGYSVFPGKKDIKLWEWVASYYMCAMGSVYKAAMPHSIRNNTFKYSSEQYVKLKTQDDLVEVIDSLKRAPSQSKTLVRFLELAEERDNVSRVELLKETTAISLNELCKKEILELVDMQIRLDKFRSRDTELSERDSEIFDHIKSKHSQKDIVLLFEKELRDKTALFCRMIEETALKGKQTLIMTPDGFSAEAVFEKLRDYFGGGVIQYHPNMSDVKRSQAYAQSCDEATVVVGSRGAVFLPMKRLGLVIVDQEHDFGYKNTESSPRLNARDVALMKASMVGAKALLCSESPTVESYYNATRGTWGLVSTSVSENRNVSFMVLERGKELLSKYLRKRVAETIEEGKQALVFQNRRGFSQWIECGRCFETPMCHHCNVSLTYHKTDNTLRCHYCGFQKPFMGVCEECGSTEMTFQGRGTERIEESLRNIFPEAKIERIDYDSTRGRGAFEQISASIATDCNIIVGTQMVVRGVDFSRVGIIGIVNADNMLSQSDFRTSERAYSLLTMLSNRVSGNDGEVVIQTTKRLDNVIKSIEERDHKKFYESEIAQRKQMYYPPTVRMIRFTLSHRSREQLFVASGHFENLLRPIFGNRISPPFEPVVDRKQDLYIIEFYLRIEREKSVVKAKEIVRTAIGSVKQAMPSLAISADVDPQ